MDEFFPDCWQSAMLLMWYDDVLPLSNTTLALFVDGITYTHETRCKRPIYTDRFNCTHMYVIAVNCEGTLLSRDEHGHLAVYGIFLTKR